jgi:hypothetical protein
MIQWRPRDEVAAGLRWTVEWHLAFTLAPCTANGLGGFESGTPQARCPEARSEVHGSAPHHPRRRHQRSHQHRPHSRPRCLPARFLHSVQHARPHLAAIARRCCPGSRRCCSRRILPSARCAIATPRLGSPAGSHAVILSRPNVSHNRRAPMPTTPPPLLIATTPSCCTGLRRSIRTEHPRRIRF